MKIEYTKEWCLRMAQLEAETLSNFEVVGAPPSQYKTYVVTGAAGFIGSRIIKALNDRGFTSIIAVDSFESGDSDKFKNLLDCQFAILISPNDFQEMLTSGVYQIEAVFHEGACSNTLEADADKMMKMNYEYTIRLISECARQNIRLIYASSAAVYGKGSSFIDFTEDAGCEQPLNVYGFSKHLADRYADEQFLQNNPRAQLVGLRYFNVYGHHVNERHKGKMMSMVHHIAHQFQQSGTVKLFKGEDGIGDGEQMRDFVHVDDVVKVNMWMLDNEDVSGIFNVGTGQPRSFNFLAKTVIESIAPGATAGMCIEYVQMPATMNGKYQDFTQADTLKLREAGYNQPFITLEDGVRGVINAY